jgi:hypothetical protein
MHMPEYKTERENISTVASTLAGAIIAQQGGAVSAEAAVTPYEKIASLIYGLSPYGAITTS